MKVYNEYNNLVKKSDCSSQFLKTYNRVENSKTGAPELVCNGKKNVYMEIQEAGIGTSFSEMMSQFVSKGVTPVIPEKKGDYLDLTSFPSNFFEGRKQAQFYENLKFIINSMDEIENKKKEKGDVENEEQKDS